MPIMPRLAVLSCFGCGILTFLLWIPLQTFLSGVCVAPLCPFRDASFITFLYWLMLDDYHWFSLDSMMERTGCPTELYAACIRANRSECAICLSQRHAASYHDRRRCTQAVADAEIEPGRDAVDHIAPSTANLQSLIRDSCYG